MMKNFVCQGFQASGIAAGIKKNNQADFGLIVSEVPAVVAGVFTRNRVQAAPVVLDRKRVQRRRCQAVVVNAGNANCCTGVQGMADAMETGRLVADALSIHEDSVLVASTGVIGQPMPMDRVRAAVPALVAALSGDGIPALAAAIMTTDLVPKMAVRHGQVEGTPYTVVAVAKGSGMIRPDMATMLCFVLTDASIGGQTLQAMLSGAVDRSFNRITVDGDTSTNDTVLLLANGLSGAAIDTPARIESFQQVLDALLLDLATMIVKDGEGATKLVTITVKGAATIAHARQVADTVASSNLVKTAFFGQDANWGRILAAAGRAGVFLDPDKIDVFFNDVQMVQGGIGCGAAAEAEATRVLKTPEFCVTLDLNMGSAGASVLTCDFSIEYVKINADYRS
jgi:glutamate N-acetyltransferase/amino-acid N-acetyltransferase